jgi:hypothetical protein
MTKKWLYIMSLLLVIAASSFFLPQFLSFFLDADTKNRTVLYYGKTFKLDAYFHHQRRDNPIGSSTWLKSTTSLIANNPQYTIELADYYLSDDQQAKAILWYKQAIIRGFDNVKLTLAKLFINQKEYQKSKALLSPLLNNSDNVLVEKSLVLLITIALIEGDLVKVIQLGKALETLNQQHALLIELTQFKVFSHAIINQSALFTINDKEMNEVERLNENCVASIQFFATNLSDLRYTENLIEQVKSSPLSNYSCFESVRYIPLHKLGCHHEKTEAITCDESIWQEYQAEMSTRFIGVMVPQGGAKVHNGIMYLDKNDTVDVFAHELAHLFGFIDEYSLPINHTRCSQIQENAFAHNVAVIAKAYIGSKTEIRNTILAQVPWRTFIKDDTPIMIKEGDKWLVGTPNLYNAEVGLFTSDTCQKTSSDDSVAFQAFKPLAKRTSLNYFELEFPELYLRLLERGSDLYLMPSFHRNIEKALTH